jgi:hypothetical protein
MRSVLGEASVDTRPKIISAAVDFTAKYASLVIFLW